MMEAAQSPNEEVFWPTTEVKRRVWQRKVLEVNGTSEMWRVVKVLTDKPVNVTHIITDNGRECVSQHYEANAFMNMYKSVSSLKLAMEHQGVMRIIN